MPTQETPETQVGSRGREDPLEEGAAAPPVFLPGQSYGHRSLAGYSPRGCKASDTTMKPLPARVINKHKPLTKKEASTEAAALMSLTGLAAGGCDCGVYSVSRFSLLSCSQGWRWPRPHSRAVSVLGSLAFVELLTHLFAFTGRWLRRTEEFLAIETRPSPSALWRQLYFPR